MASLDDVMGLDDDEDTQLCPREDLLALSTVANYTVTENYTVDTGKGHDDHSFCGIMFDVQTHDSLPLELLKITSLWVRGGLGPVSVYWTSDSYKGKAEDASLWTRVHSGHHAASDELVELVLDTAIILQAGKGCGLYVHSTAPDDQSIVYDNQRGKVTHDDKFIRVCPGRAHISPIPFSPRGYWGWAWRPNREFVGRVTYGLRYSLWNPLREIHTKFPNNFRLMVNTMMLCHHRPSSPLSNLPLECVWFIINMCPWNWLGGLSGDEEKNLGIISDEPYTAERFSGHRYYHRLHAAFNGGVDLDQLDDLGELDDEEFGANEMRLRRNTRVFDDDDDDDDVDDDDDYEYDDQDPQVDGGEHEGDAAAEEIEQEPRQKAQTHDEDVDQGPEDAQDEQCGGETKKRRTENMD